jgi:dTDP-4-amino-4,6-dideoxygalactose transaminase
MTSNGGSLIGGLASVSIVLLWLITFHKKFFVSLLKTNKVTAYGVYTTFGEALSSHFWILLKGLVVKPDRAALEAQVSKKFLQQLGETTDQTVITHSCRSIFYYIIRTLLDEAKAEKGESRIKIALPSVHFGSFYRLLRGMEKSMNCQIDFYEIDLKEDDWTFDEQDVDEEELAKCDLVLCQHLFGVPFPQDKLFQLGKKYGIPIVEDCVQSGSMFGTYKGNPLSDIVMYSGGLDKTPQCFGGGFGFFRKTPKGNHLYKKCTDFHNQLVLDTWKGRMISVFNQLVHVMIAHSYFGFNNLLGLVAYVWVSDRGDFVNWYAISLKVRKNKAITPFQHAESGFLKRPSAFQLQSMLYGFSKDYRKIALKEVQNRDLLLQNIPSKYHSTLFPWWTPKVIQQHKDNLGISEFSWVFTAKGEQRMDLCQFLNDHFYVSMINTTWEFHEFSKKPVGKHINNGLVYLPNINHLKEHSILHLANVLTKYCESVEGGPKVKKT